MMQRDNAERLAIADERFARHIGMRTMKTTPELREGDIVRNHGARVRLVRELVRRPCCEDSGHCRPEDDHGEVVSLLGVILNPEDPDAADIVSLARGERVHRERNGRWCPEGDDLLWVIQGNAMASWSVEVTPTDERPDVCFCSWCTFPDHEHAGPEVTA